MSGPPPPARGGMSLYANLLESNNDGSVTRDPVVFKQGEGNDAPAKKAIDPALRFQPIRRPQPKNANKPKPTFPKAIPQAVAPTTEITKSGNGAPTTSAAAAPAPQRSTLADWAAPDENEFLYDERERRQRGGRRKKKKKTEDRPIETNWDELYDPAHPTNVEEYLRSEERIQEVRDWKAVLYAHRRRRSSSRRSSYDSRDEEEEDRRPMNNQFAPPGSLSFAPPPLSPPRATNTTPAAPLQLDTTADEAYARRMALSGMTVPPRASPTPPQPPPPPLDSAPDAATISRAPVRYEAPPPQNDAMDLDNNDDDEVDYDAIRPPPLGASKAAADEDDANAPRSARPGQAGFAQRLMSKYGWTKGSGLGADESGITSALQVKVEKRRKRPDAEGGGYAEPGGRGKIIGGKAGKNSSSASSESDVGKFGKMSQVIVLRNMLENMVDLEAEIEAGLYQEIGAECGEKYGRVERLFVDLETRGVFIKFTDGVSALRAVNALEGRIFNGNAIEPCFYDLDKFESGVYS